MKCLLIGNYGVSNLGDELLRGYFLEHFPDIEWTVVTSQATSHRPQATGHMPVPRLPLGFRSFLTTPWWKTLRALYRCDAVVFGGGALFTDVESVKACVLWGVHAAIAIMMRKPVLLAFQGIGPFRTKAGEGIARWVVRRSRFASVRDDASARRARALAPGASIVQSFDPVFDALSEGFGRQNSGDAVLIAPRKNSTSLFLNRATDLARTWTGDILVLSFEPNDPDERRLLEDLARRLRAPSRTVAVTTLAQVREIVSRARNILTQRYHCALAALALGVPCEVIPQADDDKIAGLLPFLRSPSPALRAELRKKVSEGENALRTTLMSLNKSTK